MRVARHRDVLQLVGPLQEEVEQPLHLFHGAANPRAREQFDVQRHLVVAGAAGMHLLSQRAQAGFHFGVHVLSVNLELALQGLLTQFFQGGQQLRKLIGLQQSHLRKHRDVRHRPLYVVRGQQQIQLPVLSYGESVYLRVVVKSFVPNLLHTLSPSKSCT